MLSHSKQIMAAAKDELVAFAKTEAEGAASRMAANMAQEASEQIEKRFNATSRDVAELSQRVVASEAETASSIERVEQFDTTLARATDEAPRHGRGGAS